MRNGILFFTLLVLVETLLCCTPTPSLEGLGVPYDATAVLRGQSLVRGLAACGFCHGGKSDPSVPLSGGRVVYDTFGEVRAPNLTSSKDGIADWTPLEIMRAVHTSVAKGEVNLSFEVHRGFEWLADNDALAIVAYLKTLPPVDGTVERRTLSTLDKNTTGLFLSRPSDVGYVPQLDPKFEVQYGGYLVDHVARCIQCHNSPSTMLTAEEYLAGGATIRTEKGSKLAPGIGSSETEGIGAWSESDVVTYLKTGRSPQGQKSDPDFCPTKFYRLADERDLNAIAKYLKSFSK